MRQELDTSAPLLRIGDTEYRGQYEAALGTQVLFRLEGGDAVPLATYVGHTCTLINMHRSDGADSHRNAAAPSGATAATAGAQDGSIAMTQSTGLPETT